MSAVPACYCCAYFFHFECFLRTAAVTLYLIGLHIRETAHNQLRLNKLLFIIIHLGPLMLQFGASLTTKECLFQRKSPHTASVSEILIFYEYLFIL